jgi:hypothetical protein
MFAQSSVYIQYLEPSTKDEILSYTKPPSDEMFTTKQNFVLFVSLCEAEVSQEL